MSARAFSDDAGGRRYVRLSDGVTFYTSVEYLYEQGKVVKLDRIEWMILLGGAALAGFIALVF